jgi:hypothetical protein
LEVYNEEIRDLLGKDPNARCDLKEDPEKGVYVKDLTAVVVKDYAEIDQVLELGNKHRSVGATAMNADSSRSHSLFTVVVEMSEDLPPDPESGEVEKKIKVGKLNLVDLAGSERQSKTQAEGARLKEATKINLSLSALGNVIAALASGKGGHIPYRDSKLTRLLQSSLGGNTKTVMCACVGPADYNYDETMSTLRYANRAKNIKNKPKINEDPKDALLRQFQDEISRLQQMLEAGGGEGGGGGGGKSCIYWQFDVVLLVPACAGSAIAPSSFLRGLLGTAGQWCILVRAAAYMTHRRACRRTRRSRTAEDEGRDAAGRGGKEGDDGTAGAGTRRARGHRRPARSAEGQAGVWRQRLSGETGGPDLSGEATGDEFGGAAACAPACMCTAVNM